MKSIILYDSEKDPLLTSLPPHKTGVTLEQIRKAGQMVDGWLEKEHLWIFFHGSFHRDNGYIERGIKKLVDRGEWVSHPFEKKLVYSVKRVHRLRGHTYPSKMFHELGVTGSFVRFWRCDPYPKEFIPVGTFAGKKQVPDWAMKLSSGTTILCEFCTEDNFKIRLRRKIEGYPQTLVGIEKPLVLFICDTDTKLIEEFISRNRNLLTIMHNGKSISPYYFTDYQIFRKLPLDQILTAPIYLWQDGQKGGLR